MKLAVVVFSILLCACQTFQKDKAEIKKVSHDLIDEAIDYSDDVPAK